MGFLIVFIHNQNHLIKSYLYLFDFSHVYINQYYTYILFWAGKTKKVILLKNSSQH